MLRVPSTYLASILPPIFLFYSFQNLNCCPIQLMEIHTSGYFSFHIKWTTRWLPKVLPMRKLLLSLCHPKWGCNSAATHFCLMPTCYLFINHVHVRSFSPSFILATENSPEDHRSTLRKRQESSKSSFFCYAVYLCLLPFLGHASYISLSFYTRILCIFLNLWCRDYITPSSQWAGRVTFTNIQRPGVQSLPGPVAS